MITKEASCTLERELFSAVEEKTPDYIKKHKLIDLNNKNEFVFTLKREHLQKYDEKNNPEVRQSGSGFFYFCKIRIGNKKNLSDNNFIVL